MLRSFLVKTQPSIKKQSLPICLIAGRSLSGLELSLPRIPRRLNTGNAVELRKKNLIRLLFVFCMLITPL